VCYACMSRHWASRCGCRGSAPLRVVACCKRSALPCSLSAAARGLQADIALGGLLNGSLAAVRAKGHALKSQLNAATLTIKARPAWPHEGWRLATCPNRLPSSLLAGLG
jgi:hypothetical protein